MQVIDVAAVSSFIFLFLIVPGSLVEALRAPSVPERRGLISACVSRFVPADQPAKTDQEGSGDRIRSARASPSQLEIADVGPQTGGLQQPDADHHNHYDVQDRFDAGGHRDKAVDQVKADADYDQHDDNIQ